MKRETKSIALFDDGTRVSNYIKLHFQKKPGFSVTRVYSREELEHRMRKTPVDIIIAPAGTLVHAYPGGGNGNRICLFWSTNQGGKTVRSRDNLSFLFEIETPDTSLSYHSSCDGSLGNNLMHWGGCFEDRHLSQGFFPVPGRYGTTPVDR